MGGLSSKYSNVYEKFPNLREVECEFKALNISEKEIGRFLMLYDDCKSIERFDVNKLLDMFSIDKCGFAKYALTYYASKRKLDIDFRPFVFSLWNFCTLESHALGIPKYV